jgi:hypothetical protein
MKILEEVVDLVVRLPGTASQELAQGIRAAIAMMAEGVPEMSILRQNTRRWVESHQFRHLSRRICDLMEQLPLKLVWRKKRHLTLPWKRL